MPGRPGSWRRSSRCDTQACLEVRSDGELVSIRDSADPHGPVLTVTAPAWQAFRVALESDRWPADGVVRRGRQPVRARCRVLET